MSLTMDLGWYNGTTLVYIIQYDDITKNSATVVACAVDLHMHT